jgi:cation transport ATPase
MCSSSKAFTSLQSSSGVPIKATDEVQIVRIAAAIDTHSDHPLALAVVEDAEEHNGALTTVVGQFASSDHLRPPYFD